MGTALWTPPESHFWTKVMKESTFAFLLLSLGCLLSIAPPAVQGKAAKCCPCPADGDAAEGEEKKEDEEEPAEDGAKGGEEEEGGDEDAKGKKEKKEKPGKKDKKGKPGKKEKKKKA